MPAGRLWTAAQDDTILTMLAAREGCWLAISRVLGIPCATIRDHANKAGLVPPKAAPLPEPERPQTREPLPPGHPASWGLIAPGSPYPHPVRTDLHMSRISSNSPVGMALRGAV